MVSNYFLLALVTVACLGFLLVSDSALEVLATRHDHSHVSISSPAVSTYRIDPARSQFMAHASRGGLAWFKGHSHHLAVRDFEGTAKLSLDALNPASLSFSVKADSLEETGADFTPAQKQIINKELDDIVLESAKYPEITFRSTSIAGTIARGGFDAKITGDLTLHGATRRITIPARVTIDAETLRAIGKFEIDRTDFNVNATSAFHGLVRVQHDVDFEFDIVAVR